jgi:hypothetical protein
MSTTKKYDCEEGYTANNIYLRSKGPTYKPGSALSPAYGAQALIEQSIGRKLYPEEKATLTLKKVNPNLEDKTFQEETPRELLYEDLKVCCQKINSSFFRISRGNFEYSPEQEDTTEEVKLTITYDYECSVYDDEVAKQKAKTEAPKAKRKYAERKDVVNYISRLYNSGQFVKLCRYLKVNVPKTKKSQKVYRTDQPGEKITAPFEITRKYETFFQCTEGVNSQCCDSSSSSSSIECDPFPLPPSWNTDDIDKKVPCLNEVYSTIEGCDCIWHEACQQAYDSCMAETSDSNITPGSIKDILEEVFPKNK